MKNNFEKYGFVICNNELEFNDIFGNSKFNKIHMDTYSNEPYILFSRVVAKNVEVTSDKHRITLRDKDGTTIMNIPVDNMSNCVVKKYADSTYQILFNVYNVEYKMLVII